MALSMKNFTTVIRRKLRRKFSTSSSLYDRRVRVRFAPSPTGYMHLGSIRTALYNYLFAKSQGGSFILRIEDTDQSRLVSDATEKLIESLEWTRIKADEGPGIGGDYGPYIQSQRKQLYHENLEILVKKGAAYRCFCSNFRLDLIKKDAKKRGEIPKYDNKCRHLSSKEIESKLQEGEQFVYRFNLHSEDHTPFHDLVYGRTDFDVAEVEGDPIIIKSDGMPTYHFANVVDDHLMEISHVFRGEEWKVSTPKHLLLYKAFGWDPPLYGHLPLIKNRDGTKLSKRQGDIQMSHFQENGYMPEAIVKYLTMLGGGFTTTAGHSIDYDTFQDLVDKFSINKISTNHGHIDQEILKQVNRVYLRAILKENPSQVVQQATQIIKKYLHQRFPDSSHIEKLITEKYVSDILHWATSENRLCKVTDLTSDSWDFLWHIPTEHQIQSLSDNPKLKPHHILKECVSSLSLLADFSESNLRDCFKHVAKEQKCDMKSLMNMLRISLSGLKHGPPVAEMVNILGRQNTLTRLQHAQSILQQ